MPQTVPTTWHYETEIINNNAIITIPGVPGVAHVITSLVAAAYADPSAGGPQSGLVQVSDGGTPVAQVLWQQYLRLFPTSSSGDRDSVSSSTPIIAPAGSLLQIRFTFTATITQLAVTGYDL